MHADAGRFSGHDMPNGMMTTTPDAFAPWVLRPLGAISETVLRARGAEVLRHLVRLGVDASCGNRIAEAVTILDQVSRDELVPSVDNIAANQLIIAAMRAIYEAVIIVDARLRDSPQSHLFTNDRLRSLVKGALQSGASDAAANRRFEAFFAALLVTGGFTVQSAEPDWRIQYFDETLGIAVKRLNASTTDAAQNLLRNGARQIKRQSLRGIVVLNVERLIHELPGGLDAAEYGVLFNEKLRGLQEQFDHLARYPSLIALVLTGLAARWTFPIRATAGLLWSTPFQCIGFSDIEPAERFEEFFVRQFAPRFRNAINSFERIVGPAPSL